MRGSQQLQKVCRTCLVVVVERRVPSQENVGDDADAPHVHRRVVVSVNSITQCTAWWSCHCCEARATHASRGHISRKLGESRLPNHVHHADVTTCRIVNVVTADRQHQLPQPRQNYNGNPIFILCIFLPPGKVQLVQTNSHC